MNHNLVSNFQQGYFGEGLKLLRLVMEPANIAHTRFDVMIA